MTERIHVAVVSILSTRRPTSYGEQFRARRASERASERTTKGKCIREFPICGCGLVERGARAGSVGGTGGVRRGALLW